MPVKDCTTNGRPGKKWGDAGKCYPCAGGGDCTEATKKAQAQGIAIGDIPVDSATISLYSRAHEHPTLFHHRSGA